MSGLGLTHGRTSRPVHELQLTRAGLDESLTYLHKAMIEQGPFDGIMGFSQGACMAAVLAALVSPGIGHRLRSFRSFQLETPNLHPLWPSEPAIPKLKCACPKSAL